MPRLIVITALLVGCVGLLAGIEIPLPSTGSGSPAAVLPGDAGSSGPAELADRDACTAVRPVTWDQRDAGTMRSDCRSR